MGFLDRFFGKKNTPSDATAADRLRSQHGLAGRAIDATQEEQSATRGRMEAEVAAQRQTRADDAATKARPDQ